MHFWLFLGSFSWFFQERCFLEGCCFCVAFSIQKRLIWAIKNNIRKYFQICHHKRGSLTVKKLPYVEKKGQTKFQFFFERFDQMEQENGWQKFFFHHIWCYRDTLPVVNGLVHYSKVQSQTTIYVVFFIIQNITELFTVFFCTVLFCTLLYSTVLAQIIL